MSFRTQYTSSHLFFLTSVAPSLRLCQYGASAPLYLRSPLLVLPNLLGASLPLRHCFHFVMDRPPPRPPPWGWGFLTALGAAASVHPTFWFSSPPTPHLGFKFKGTLKEALCDWAVIIQGTVTTWAELLHQPILLATRHSMYGCLWVRPQFSVPFAVAGEAGLRVTCVTAGL